METAGGRGSAEISFPNPQGFQGRLRGACWREGPPRGWCADGPRAHEALTRTTSQLLFLGTRLCQSVSEVFPEPRPGPLIRVSEHPHRTLRILRVAEVIWGTVWTVRPELTVLFLSPDMIHPNTPAPPARGLPRVSGHTQWGHLPNSTSQTSHPVSPSPACENRKPEADPAWLC